LLIGNDILAQLFIEQHPEYPKQTYIDIYIYKYDVCTFNVDYTMAQYLLLLFHVVFFSWYPRLEA
jgi:hypothetical protein